MKKSTLYILSGLLLGSLFSLSSVYADPAIMGSTSSQANVIAGDALFAEPPSCDRITEKIAYDSETGYKCINDGYINNDGFDTVVWCYNTRNSGYGSTARLLGGSCIESQPGEADWPYYLKQVQFAKKLYKKTGKVEWKYWSLTYPDSNITYYTSIVPLTPMSENMYRIKKIIDETPFKYFNSEYYRKAVGDGNVIPCTLNSGKQDVTCNMNKRRRMFGYNYSDAQYACPLKTSSVSEGKKTRTTYYVCDI